MTTSTLAGFSGKNLGADVGKLGVGGGSVGLDVLDDELLSSITVIGFCLTRPMITTFVQTLKDRLWGRKPKCDGRN